MTGNCADFGTITDIKGLDARACRNLAAARKESGRFDALTLACFRQSARLSRDPASLVAWLTFRRELGYPMPTLGVPLLNRVRWRLGPQAWLDACHLVAESGRPPWRLPLHYLPFLRRFCAMSATLSASYAEHPLVRGTQLLRGVSEVVLRQEMRRQAFFHRLRATRRICVVGNAARMNGSGMGARIDGHDCVVRFNQYSGADSRAEDIGTRTDVWVRMPGVPRPTIPVQAQWVVLSGPDVRFRSSNWLAMQPVIDAGKPILTVPLPIWQSLVARLGAPPSAGALFLAWLREIRNDGLAGVSLIGFNRVDSLKDKYHHAVPGKPPGARHAWPGERDMIQAWAESDGAVWLV